MTDLSPAAQAVADAFEEAWRMTPEADPFECCLSPVAAALRAAALHIDDASDGLECQDILRQIAAELEGE